LILAFEAISTLSCQVEIIAILLQYFLQLLVY
jgi:hypothetical protein